MAGRIRPFTMTVDVRGRRETMRMFRGVTVRAAHMKPAFEKIARSFQNLFIRQFASEGGWAGGGWAPTQDKTDARKVKEGKDPHILRATDRLRDSLCQRRHPDHYEVITDRAFVYGTRVPYARVHDQGSDDGTTPQRRILELRPRDNARHIEIMRRWIIRGEV